MKLRTFFLARFPEEPAHSGAHLRNLQNIHLLRALGEVRVVSLFGNDGRPIGGLTSGGKTRPALESLGTRFIPPPYRIRSETASAVLSEVRRFQPDLIVLSHLTTGPYLNVARELRCPVILDEHNVESTVRRKPQGWKNGIKHRLVGRRYLRRLEKRLVQSADRVWVCSGEDRELLRDQFGEALAPDIVPNGIRVEDYRTVPTQEHRIFPGPREQTILYAGAFDYEPNVRAAKRLIRDIFPQVRNLYPQARLLLVGKAPPEDLLSLAKEHRGVFCTGTVSDIRPYLSMGAVTVIPIEAGGGTRLKILEAFASKIPVVSTRKGVEGIAAKEGVHLLIREENESMVEAIRRIWSPGSLRHHLVENAYRLVCDRYSWQAIQGTVERSVEDVLGSFHGPRSYPETSGKAGTANSVTGEDRYSS